MADTTGVLRVLHVIPSVSPTQGGPSHAVSLMERALHAAGVQAETATTTDDGPGRRLQRRTGMPMAEGPVRRWYFYKLTEFYKVAPGCVPWLLRSVRRYDVVHIHALFSFTCTAAAWVAWLRGVPYIVRPLGVLAAYGMQARRPWLKRLSFSLIEGPILRRAAVVHFTSQTERDEALALGVAMRSAVVPLAVETISGGQGQRALQALAPPAAGLRLLFLSRLDPKKNLDNLIRAVGLLRRQGLTLTLLVAGSGPAPLAASLRALADEEGVTPDVRWLGHVAGADKADVLAAAEVFVLPSYSENFGIAVAEALAAGLPCVVGQGVALAAQVQAAGAGLVTTTDTLAISAAIAALAGDPARRQAMGTAARQLAANEFSPQAMASRLQALYRGAQWEAGVERR